MSDIEYRISVTVAEHGAEPVAENNMEIFTETFATSYPAAGAVAAADFSRHALDVTFSVNADDARSAVELGLDMFCEVAIKTDLDPSDILDIAAHIVPTHGHEELTGELALAY